MRWATWMLQDIQENESLISKIVLWLSLVRTLSRLELSLYRNQAAFEGIREDHKFIVFSLLTAGGSFRIMLESMPADKRKDIESAVTLDQIKTALKNLESSYEEWHVEVSESSKSAILEKLGIGDRQTED